MAKKKKTTLRTGIGTVTLDPKAPNASWDLYDNGTFQCGLSYSLLSKWLDCRERARLHIIERIEESGRKDALDFGNISHDMLEWKGKGKTLRTIQTTHRQKVRETVKQLTSSYAKEYQLTADLALGVFQKYIEHWGPAKGERELASETCFVTPYRLPSGRTIPLRGKIDSLMEILKGKQKQLWVQDHKTKGKIDVDTIAANLHKDLQVMMYIIAVESLTKKEVQGIRYNVIRRPQLKQRSGESDKVFVQRCLDDIDDRPGFYFKRFNTEIYREDVELFKKTTLHPILEQVCVWWESIRHNPFDPWHLEDGSPNPHHWERPFGVYDTFRYGKGGYFDLIVRGTKAGLVPVKTLFPELDEEESVDKLLV